MIHCSLRAGGVFSLLFLSLLLLTPPASAYRMAYIDQTFSHDLRCCNATDCVTLVSNSTAQYSLDPVDCYVLPGVMETDFLGFAQTFLPGLIGLFVGVCFVFFLGVVVYRRLKK